jgi:ABC-2 type transport system permease protein
MKLTLTSISIELGKIFLRKKYSVLSVIQLAICFLAAFGLNSAKLATGYVALDLPTLPYIILGALTSVVLPMFVFMAAADSFAHEIEDGSIKCVLMRPISRVKIFLSKLAAIWLFSLINLMASFAVIAAARIVFQGSAAELPDIFISYAVSSVPMIPFAALGSLVAVAVSNSTMSMFVSVISYLVMVGTSLWSPTTGAAFFTSHLGFYKLFLGLSLNLPSIGNTLFLLISSASLLSLGGFWLFDEKQL